jgi:hypothetical protein
MVRCGELFNPLGPARPPPPGACRPARPGSEDLKSAPRPDAGTVVTSLTRLQLTNNNFHQFESTFYRNRKFPRFWFYRVTARAAFSQLGDGVPVPPYGEIRDIPRSERASRTRRRKNAPRRRRAPPAPRDRAGRRARAAALPSGGRSAECQRRSRPGACNVCCLCAPARADRCYNFGPPTESARCPGTYSHHIT